MAYIAKLVSVAKYKNITTKLKPFVEFQSSLDQIDLEENDEIAVLQIEGTESYIAIFLKTKPTIEQIESKLEKQETKLNVDAKKILLKYINGT